MSYFQALARAAAMEWITKLQALGHDMDCTGVNCALAREVLGLYGKWWTKCERCDRWGTAENPIDPRTKWCSGACGTIPLRFQYGLAL